MVDFGRVNIGGDLGFTRPPHERLSLQPQLYGGRTAGGWFPAFSVTVNTRQFEEKMARVLKLMSLEGLEADVRAVMDKTLALLKRSTPGPSKDPRHRRGTPLREQWKIEKDLQRTGSQEGNTLRLRLKNTTRFRPLLRWLEEGTVGHGKKTVGAGRRRITPQEVQALRRQKKGVKGALAEGVQTSSSLLWFPASAWPGGRIGPQAMIRGIPFYVFGEVQHRGIEGTHFFRHALTQLEADVKNLKQRILARFRGL